jgi:TonB-like protein
MTITPRSLTASRRAFLIALVGSAAHVGTPVIAIAQTLQGVVIDQSTRRPLGGARLDLLSDSGIAVAKTVADSGTGMFYLTPPAGGHYSLQIVVGRGGLFNSQAFQLDSGQTIERTFAIPPLPQAMLDAYLSADVSRAALLQPKQKMPRYPDRLRARGIGGLVRAVVVVDSTGRPEMSTFRVLEADDAAFADAVRDVVEDWHYFPAELDGHPVAQVSPVLADFGLGDAPSRFRPGELGIVIRALGVVRVKPAPSREP